MPAPRKPRRTVTPPADQQLDQSQAGKPFEGTFLGQDLAFGEDHHLVAVRRTDGSVVPLAELPEADQRALATFLEIEGAETMPLDQLLVALQAQTLADDQDQDQEILEHANTFIVQRELLEHDGIPFTHGDELVIEDELQAEALLNLGAITRSTE